MTNLKNQRRAGFYWINRKPYVSVTEILRVLDKPGLRYWFGKQVFLAMAKDPSLSESEALSAPYKISDKARQRGSMVHSLIEMWKGKKCPTEFEGYMRGFESWLKSFRVKILLTEKTVVNETYCFAGTLDLLVEIDGEKVVVDVKTGKSIYKEAFLQLSAYKNALKEKVDGMAVLLLKPDGNYIFERGQDFFNIFLAVKKVWEWQNQELLESLRR